jgi:hypothetical protein
MLLMISNMKAEPIIMLSREKGSQGSARVGSVLICLPILALLICAVVLVVRTHTGKQLESEFQASIVPPKLIAIFDDVRMSEEIFVIRSSENVELPTGIISRLRPRNILIIKLLKVGIECLTSAYCPVSARTKNQAKPWGYLTVELYGTRSEKVGAIVPYFQPDWFAAPAVVPDSGPLHDRVPMKVLGLLRHIFQEYERNLSSSGEIQLPVHRHDLLVESSSLADSLVGYILRPISLELHLVGEVFGPIGLFPSSYGQIVSVPSATVNLVKLPTSEYAIHDRSNHRQSREYYDQLIVDRNRTPFLPQRALLGWAAISAGIGCIGVGSYWLLLGICFSFQRGHLPVALALLLIGFGLFNGGLAHPSSLIYFIGCPVQARLGGGFRSPTNLRRANKSCPFPPPGRLPANPRICHATTPRAYYNFLSAIAKRCGWHAATEAGRTNHLWTLEGLVRLLDPEKQ